jgi:hypothetical protein
MSRILPMAWAGFGSLATIGIIYDPRMLLAAISVGLFASVGEVLRDG